LRATPAKLNDIRNSWRRSEDRRTIWEIHLTRTASAHQTNNPAGGGAARTPSTPAALYARTENPIVEHA
jgi:hypothetical protein